MASVFGIQSSKTLVPKSQGTPATAMLSFMTTRLPASSPSDASSRSMFSIITLVAQALYWFSFKAGREIATRGKRLRSG